MALVAEFARRLRIDLGTSVAYWYSPELHPGGHGWHVNLFIAGRLDHARVGELWGHGFVGPLTLNSHRPALRASPSVSVAHHVRAGDVPLGTAVITPRRIGNLDNRTAQPSL